MYKIVIKNTVTNQEYVYDNIEDINGGKKLYYNFNIDTSNLDDGEYKLTLFKGDDIVCTELLKVGDFNSDKIQYSKGANVYIDAKPTKIDVAATGIKLGKSTFREVPDIYDFSNVTDMSYMFSDCSSLQSIPNLNASNATNMAYMFTGCEKLTSIEQLNTSNVTEMFWMFNGCSSLQSIPQLNTAKVNNMGSMFYECRKLQSIPLLDTSNVKTMYSMFYRCSSLTTIPMLDTSNTTRMSSMFFSCSSLTTIPPIDTSKVAMMDSMFGNCTSLQSLPLLDCGKVSLMSNFFGYFTIPTLTDLGGFKNLDISVTSSFLDKAPNLTVESLMNVINNVYDLTANGLSGQSLKFGSTNLNKLTEEQIAVATAKGWTLTA